MAEAPNVYFDASALVKLVRTEAGTPTATQLWSGPGRAFASRLASVEVAAALCAGHRNHQISGTALDTMLAQASAHRDELQAVELTPAVSIAANTLARRHALKGADAVHLASALALRDPALVVATWDRRLHQAARAEGLRVAPAELPA